MVAASVNGISTSYPLMIPPKKSLSLPDGRSLSSDALFYRLLDRPKGPLNQEAKESLTLESIWYGFKSETASAILCIFPGECRITQSLPLNEGLLGNRTMWTCTISIGLFGLRAQTLLGEAFGLAVHFVSPQVVCAGHFSVAIVDYQGQCHPFNVHSRPVRLEWVRNIVVSFKPLAYSVWHALASGLSPCTKDQTAHKQMLFSPIASLFMVEHFRI